MAKDTPKPLEREMAKRRMTDPGIYKTGDKVIYDGEAPKRRRGRPSKGDDAKTGAERQSLYTKRRGRDMAEVAYALKDLLLRTKANQKAFTDSYRGTMSGDRLRRGLARLLADDPEALAFFEGLISSDDRK
jgi:hypothetical protein